jgi:hypothetical protein
MIRPFFKPAIIAKNKGFPYIAARIRQMNSGGGCRTLRPFFVIGGAMR